MSTTMQAEHSKFKNKQREYLEKIKPYVDAKAKIYAFSVPTIIVNEGGQVKTSFNFDKETTNALHNLDVLINKELELFRKSY